MSSLPELSTADNTPATQVHYRHKQSDDVNVFLPQGRRAGIADPADAARFSGRKNRFHIPRACLPKDNHP
ncbi:hypothetical protein A9B99_11595 [Mangrovibacter phragmitis]|uniref:Uncharacterized protein n=1 Tax=Mangrovibacter phragmitis TaxID=1691903 RepID=A0A1B7L1Q5_9ENTR|nr:hypothetical protein A9B99_11595 [Mangrovibacter phragmitis]